MDSKNAAIKIQFNTVVDQVLDAFTGGPLASEFSRCETCSCCYGAESVKALREHNSGQCIGCGASVFASTGR